MTLPKNTRNLRTNELPTPGTRVYVPENTTAFAGVEPTPGWQTVGATNSNNGTVAVDTADGYTSWVLSRKLLVENDSSRRPTVGDWVLINAPGEPGHGEVCEIIDDDGSALPYCVRYGPEGAEWFYPSQVSLVDDGEAPAPDSALVSVRHEVTVTIERPATAGQLAAGAAAIDPDWPVIVNVHPDRIEIYAHHEETRE